MVHSISDVQSILTPIFDRYGISRAVLFGSVAKGTATAKSDLDLVVDSKLRGLKFVGFMEDVRQAAEYYQRTLTAPVYASRDGAANRLGAFYFNGQGVEQDYAKAFQLLKWAYDQSNTNNWGAYYLGACYAYGRGTQQDYAAARKFLEMVDWNNRSAFYLLGYLYARGLGGPEDIPKGVEYLQKAGDHAEAREELRRYKKTFFGKWVRR